MSNFWDQEEPFRDGFPDQEELKPGDFAHEMPRRRAPKGAPEPVQVQEQPEQQDEQGEDPDEDYTDVLSDARLRLEQGRLYELLMNHNLFEGVEADPRAIRNVQREIRQYARERMEIMLGMRKTGPARPDQPSSGHFNEVEVSVLKMLAKAASNGKTEKPEKPAPREGLAPITASRPPEQAIRSVAKVDPPKMAAVQTKPKATPVPAKTAPKPPAKPVKPLNRKKNETIEKILAEQGISRELLEEDYVPLEKDPALMTEQEKLERNRQIAERRRLAPAPNAVPMPSYEQQLAQYTAQAHEVASMGAMPMLLAAIARKK